MTNGRRVRVRQTNTMRGGKHRNGGGQWNDDERFGTFDAKGAETRGKLKNVVKWAPMRQPNVKVFSAGTTESSYWLQ